MDYTFASAFLSAKAATLLDRDQFLDIKKADDDGFILRLQALGYGIGAKGVDVEEIIAREISLLKSELLFILPDDALVVYFFHKYDLTNIRTYYKTRFFNLAKGPIERVGFLDERTLERAIIFGDCANVREPYKTLFAAIEGKSFADPSELSAYLQVTFQDIMYEDILARCDEPLMAYFVLSTDIANLSTLLRARQFELEPFMLKSALLERGEMPIADILALCDADSRAIIERYSRLYMSRFKKPLEQFFLGGGFASLEHALLKVLLDELKPFQSDIRSSASIISYVVSKQIEMADVRRLYVDRSARIMADSR